MDFSILRLLFIVFIFFVIYVANRADSAHPGRIPVQLLLLILIGLVAVMLLPLAIGVNDEISTTDIRGYATPILRTEVLLLLLLYVLLSLSFVVSTSLRQHLRALIRTSGTFNPDSAVHTTAVILALLWLLFTFLIFIQIGGQTGLAESLRDESTLNVTTVVLDDVLYLLFAIVGVGLFIRRSPRDVVARLGLQRPSLEDMMWGVTAGVGLFILISIVSIIWNATTAPEVFESQNAAARQIVQAFGTLSLGFILAVSSAVGEEILYRGAVQPVLGLWLTSALFAVSHIQYTLTPASLLIFIVGLAFGVLRQRRNTNTAIIAHFVYNFIPFLLLSIASTQVI